MEAIRLKSIHRSILQALFSLASAALLIRVVGLANQIVVTARFGAGPRMDAYFVASTLPLLLARLLSDALEASVVPIYVQVQAQGDKERLTRFFSTLLNACLLSTGLATLLMLAFRSQLLFFSSPALDPLRLGLAFDLAPLFFLCFFLMTVLGFLEAILNAEGQFGWPAYAGVLVPLSTVLLVLVLSAWLGIAVLGIGMLLGLCLQGLLFLLRLRRAGITYRPVLALRLPEIRLVLGLAWPVLLAAIATQALPFFDQVVASYLSPGNISALNYANKLISVPVGVIFVSLGRAALPYLSRFRAANNMQAFKETLRLYLWGGGLVTLLIMLFLLFFAHPVVRLLFQRGAFSAADTDRTVSALLGFSLGLVPMASGFLLSRSFSALGKTRVLMGTTLFSVFANTLFDVLFAHFWQEFGIALATSAVYVCTLCILLFVLRRTIGPLSLLTVPNELRTVLRMPGRRQAPKEN